MGGRASGQPADGRPVRLGRRDREMLSWIARWASATHFQLVCRFRTPPLWRRFKELRLAGLVGYERPYEDLPGVHYLTGVGAAEVGVQRPAPPVASWALWGHLAVLDLVARFEADGEGVALAPRELETLPEVRDRLPRLPAGTILPPDALLITDSELRPVYVVPQSALTVPLDRLRAVTLDALLQLEPATGVRPIVVVDARQTDDARRLAARDLFDIRLVSETVGRAGVESG